jgi:hypothetical protein
MDASMNTMQQDKTRMDVRARRDEMREFPSSLCLLRLIVIKHQTLLLRSLHSTRNKVSNPLERLSTREPQAPLCQICCKQSSSPNAR